MKKPPSRPAFPERESDNDKRRLLDGEALDDMRHRLKAGNVHYQGRARHKLDPWMFGLQPPYNRVKSDPSLCDAQAGFDLAAMATIPALIQRGLDAGLIGKDGRIFWTVADSGWIFEARVSNETQWEYHGYPIGPSEAVARIIYRRYRQWTALTGSPADLAALDNCNNLYNFK